MSQLSAEELMAQASAATDLDDFGEPTFLEGLAHYCDSVNETAQLNEFGGLAVPGTVIAALCNRLKVVDYRRAHPEVSTETVTAPLVVIGMFRAGTTLLSNLLEADPANRPLLRWEAGDSVPPATPDTFRTGPRVEAAQAGSELLESINPAMRAIHHEDAHGPTECISVMSQDFKSLSWEAITNVASYGQWLLATDHTSAYRYHHDVLQVLQHGGVRGRWTLKSPHHAIALDALTAVYPDARLVVLHRDPAVLCASVCSLIRTLSATFSDADHRPYIARHWVDDVLRASIDRVEAFRRTHPNHTVVDVHYGDFVADPVATVGRIYAETGHGPFDDQVATRMAEQLAAHPANRFGTHQYSLDEFGLQAGELRERFADYMARYDIPADRRVG